jgi:hypothetical protein
MVKKATGFDLKEYTKVLPGVLMLLLDDDE